MCCGDQQSESQTDDVKSETSYFIFELVFFVFFLLNLPNQCVYSKFDNIHFLLSNSGLNNSSVVDKVMQNEHFYSNTNVQNTQINPKPIAACKKYSNYAEALVTNTFAHGIKTLPIGFPHLVALGYSNEANLYDFDCSGTLIADRWVITAASCVDDKKQPSIVRMGKVNT